MIVGVVEPRDGINARAFGLAAGNDKVGYADDGGGVHAAAQLREDWTVGAELAPDGCGKNSAEVFLVFSIGVVTDSLPRIEIPILADDVLYAVFAEPQEHRRGWPYGMNTDIRRQMRGRKRWYHKPASDVLFADFERFSRKPDERIEDGGPGDVVFFERVVELMRADGIFGQEQTAVEIGRA